MNSPMASRLRVMLAIMWVTLFTTAAFASPLQPSSGVDVPSTELASADDLVAGVDHDSRMHLCFQACHLTMLEPAVAVFEPGRLATENWPLPVWTPHGTIMGPLLLPPIA